MEMNGPLTLSAYMADRFSTRSEIAWSLLRTTMSSPRSRKYRIFVPFGRQFRTFPRNVITWKHTVTIGQRGEGFPDRDVLEEIQDIPQDWIALWTRWV